MTIKRFHDNYGMSTSVPKALRCMVAVTRYGYCFWRCCQKCGYGPNGAYCEYHARKLFKKQGA